MNKEQEKKRADEADLCNRLRMIVDDAVKPYLEMSKDDKKETPGLSPELFAVLNFTVTASFTAVGQSLMIGVLGALVFRQTRLAILRRGPFSWQSPTSSKQFLVGPVPKVQLQSTVTTHTRTSVQETHPSFPARLVGFIGDLGVGACLTYGTVRYYFATTLPERIIATVARLPLIEGRSKVAECLCDDIVAELQRSSDVLQEGVHEPFLWLAVLFAGNCERRRAYERHLRLSQPRLLFSSVIPVPPPGVPPDFPVKGGAADRRFRNESGLFANDPDWWKKSYTNDIEWLKELQKSKWAESFTTDLEEDARKNGS